MYQEKPQRSHLRAFLKSAVLFIVILSIGFLYTKRASLFDGYMSSTFNESSEIRSVVDDTKMTEYASKIFYASTPKMVGASDFRDACGENEERTATLGCYRYDDSCNIVVQYVYSTGCVRVYIFRVENTKLTGINQVTGAHEMLHAAYARLDSDTKTELIKLLDQKADSLQDDERFTKRMSSYDDISGNDRYSELHSILGTEVSDLGNELDDHYAKYFQDRQAVVDLYHSYADQFFQMDEAASDLAESLKQQASDINGRIDTHNKSSSELSVDIEDFNRRAESGYFGSQGEFLLLRAELMQRVDDSNSERDKIQQAIDDYEKDLSTYNSLVTNLQKLNNSIDSSLTTVPAV